MNVYGVDSRYYEEQINLITRNLYSYKPAELARALARLGESVSPGDTCKECEKQALVIFDDDSNECLSCQNIQNVKGT